MGGKELNFQGTGTEVHSNMQLPGYCSFKNINGNTGNVGWPLHPENRNSGQYSDLFLTRPAMGYDKEQMRQTILKHDSIFRHQLHELHRLYGVQRDMMDEIKSQEGNKHLKSQFNPFSSGFMSEDEQKSWHGSDSNLLDLNSFRLSKSSEHSFHSQFTPLKGNVGQSGCCLSQNGFTLKNCETLESQRNKVRSRLFDLQCPAEEYTNNEGGGQGVSAVSGLESYHLKRSYEVPLERDENLSMHYSSNYSSNGEATSSNFNLKRTRGLTDLNQPILVEESSTSDCVGIPGNITFFEEKVQRKYQPSVPHSYLGLCQWDAEFCQEPHKNLHLEAERRQNGWFSNKFENGETGSNGSLHPEPEDLHNKCQSVQVEATNAHSAMFLLSDQKKRETFRKWKIFGVEIPEKNNGTSSIASHALDPLPVRSRSDSANSEIVTCSTGTKFSGNLSHNLLGNPGSRTYGNSSTGLMQGHDIIRGKLLVDSNSRSLPSFRAEASPQNDVNLSFPSDSKESRGCWPLVALRNQSGIAESKFGSKQSAQHGPKISFRLLPWLMEEAKSAVDLNMGANDVKSFQHEEISQSYFVSVDESLNNNSDGGLSWLRATRPIDAKPIKDIEGSGQMNLNSLQNCSKQSIDKTAMRIQDSLSPTCVDDVKHRKSDASFSSNSSKFLGFSISENVCRDLPSINSPLKPGFPASAIGGINFVNIHGSLPPKCGQECPVEGVVAETRPVDQNADFRHIDMNVCVNEERIEEDFQPTSSSIRTNVMIAQIDLDMPLTIERGTKVTCGCESLESNLKKPSNLVHTEISDSQGRLSVSAAAGALVAISSSSSSCVINLQQNTSSRESEISESDSLHWFAGIVTSRWSDTEYDVGPVNDACLVDSIADGTDIFEFMTLNLTETKVEQCCYNPQVPGNKKREDTLPRRPRRRQARGGRQRKDFQRDVLPSLMCLSRNEVREDFQMIEGLIRAMGGNWKSSLTQKNNVRGSTGRGRKRAGGSSPPTMTEGCTNQCQKMKTGLEERSLTGWGKRTRCPPRQRCLIIGPPLAIK